MDNENSIAKYLVPRLQDILFALVFYLILILGTNLIRDGDPGRHITLGKYMIENKMVITKDLFSYTIHGQPIAVHEWFSEVIYGAAYLFMGLNGVILAAAILLSTTSVLILRELIDRDTPRLLAFGLTLWAVVITMIHWLARPHLVTYLCLALYVSLIGRIYRDKDASLWAIGATVLLWANSHGGFIYGVVVWGAYFVGWLIENFKTPNWFSSPIFKKLASAGIVSFLASLLNPAGLGLWNISVGYVSKKYFVDRISEYRSVDFHSPGAWPFWVFMALALLLILRAEKKQSLGEAFLIAGFTALGVYSVRNVPPYAIVVVPLVGTYFTPYFESVKGLIRFNTSIEILERNLRGTLWPLLVIIICASMLLSGAKLDAFKQGYQFNKYEFPVEAVDWLQENPQSGNMFNWFRWGGYLIYLLWPDQLVFMDGQTEYFGERLTRQHDQILEAQTGWQDAIAEHDIQWMLVPVNSRIDLVLQESQNWKTLYRDETAVIFRKQP